MKNLANYRISPKINKILMEIERFQGVFEKHNKLSPKLVSSLKKTTIITSSGSSTRIIVDPKNWTKKK